MEGSPIPEYASAGRYLLLSLLAVAAIIAALLYFDTEKYILTLFAWMETLGYWGPVLFIFIDTLIVVFILPGVMFTLGAGFLFGPLMGSLYVMLATTLGGTIAFLIARYLFSKRTSEYLLRHEKLNIISDEFTQEGWKIILLTRLIPFFPFKLSNYFFGVTRFSLQHYIVGTFVGIIPITFFNVYMGSLAADLTTIGLSRTQITPFQWLIYALGLIVTIITITYITIHARKALNKYLIND